VAVTHRGRPPRVGEPAEPAPVDEILDHVVSLVDDLGRDLGREPEASTAGGIMRFGRRRRFWRETVSASMLSIIAFAAVVATELLVFEWLVTR
jgi:hypothetical protein